MNITVSLVEKKEDIIEYEKALYRNFKPIYPEYAEEFFTEIDGIRLKPLTPYEDQLIYGVYRDKELISAGSYCIKLQKDFEIEKMGFKIDKTENVCEGLHFYSEITQKAEFNLEIYRSLAFKSFKDLLSRGINTIYSSCTKNRLIMYKFIGFEIIDKIEYTGETEYLIKRVITEDFEENLFDVQRMMS